MLVQEARDAREQVLGPVVALIVDVDVGDRKSAEAKCGTKGVLNVDGAARKRRKLLGHCGDV